MPVQCSWRKFEPSYGGKVKPWMPYLRFLLFLWVGASAAQSGSVVNVPLGDQAKWQVLQYRKIPPHRVQFSKAGLEMQVNGSAMPLIYPLPKALAVKRVRVKGRIEGKLDIPPGRQGQEGYDDYAFRIGLVEPGERTLGSIRRRFVADWVRKLYELAPEGSGISGIRFYNVAVEKAHIGAKRQHPLSELLHEEAPSARRGEASGYFGSAQSAATVL